MIDSTRMGRYREHEVPCSLNGCKPKTLARTENVCVVRGRPATLEPNLAPPWETECVGLLESDRHAHSDSERPSK